MTEFQPTRLQRLPTLVALLLHIIGMVVGAGLFIILAVIVGMIFQIEDKNKIASLMLSFFVVGAILPSVLLWRARRQSPAPAFQKEETERPPQSRASKDSNILASAVTPKTSNHSKILTVFAFIGIFWLIFFIVRSDFYLSLKNELARAGELPRCDSTTTADMLKEIVRRAPSNKIINLEAYAVKEARELSWDADRQIRRCTAKVYLNAGVDSVDFKIYWIDRPKAEFFVETE